MPPQRGLERDLIGQWAPCPSYLRTLWRRTWTELLLDSMISQWLITGYSPREREKEEFWGGGGAKGDGERQNQKEGGCGRVIGREGEREMECLCEQPSPTY